MGSMYSMLSNQNMTYYLFLAYFILTIFAMETPSKKEKPAFLRNNENPSRPRLLNRKRWLESEIQLLHEELAHVSHELEEPIIPESVRALIRAEVQNQVQQRRD